MNTELEDLERRVELLEGRLASIEHRLDAHQIHLDIVTDWHQAEREAGPSASAVDQEPRSDTPDAHFGRVESMLRQMLLYQADQAAGLRKVTRSVQILAERKAS
jgi:hypothetical protein